MASWLKAAEDIFEGVDRRVKLVAGDRTETQPAPSTDNNGQRSEAKKTRPKKKKPLPSSASSAEANNKQAQSLTEAPESRSEVDVNVPLLTNRNSESTPTGNTQRDEQHKDQMDVSVSGTTSKYDAKQGADHPDAETSSSETVPSKIKLNRSTDEDKQDTVKDTEVVIGETVVNSDHGLTSEFSVPRGSSELESHTQDEDELPQTGQVKTAADVQTIPEHQEKKASESAVEVQEQLDEAQGLLRSANSKGQSKEARLARVCAGLSARLQEYKSENSQLEELLVAEKELTRSYEAHIKQLKKDLTTSKDEANKAESNMLEALAAKNAEIESLISSVDSLKKQAALAEENLAALQETMESIMRNRELAETRMIQALREEVAAAERRVEEERSSHNAMKLAAREREVELEQRAIEATAALVKIQRTADDRASKAAEIEQKMALLEIECASLNQELQHMEARARLGQKKSSEDANQVMQVQALQEEVDRARQGQREAESKLSSLEADAQKMRVELASMKRHVEHYSLQEHMELEKRYRELTDLLYYKQTQLETMASEKAAAEFQLEKEVKRLQDAQLEAERNRASRRAASSWVEDSDIKALEPLPVYHRHLAGASLQLQRAAKLLDNGAVRATRFLWRYPTARVILLFYLVFVHLFLMYLLHHLQEQADRYTSKEVAESMGLLNNKKFH